MPFDSAEATPAINRKILIDGLRRIEKYKDFTWDFENILTKVNCGTAGCAIGLACIIWPNKFQSKEVIPDLFAVTDEEIMSHFGMTKEEVAKIFYNNEGNSEYEVFYGCYNKGVTPNMVADALEALN